MALNINLGDLIQYRFKRGGIVAGRNVAEVVGFERISLPFPGGN